MPCFLQSSLTSSNVGNIDLSTFLIGDKKYFKKLCKNA
nr:MAG TPA: hypothetical protein [Caudoviricetes sp.]